MDPSASLLWIVAFAIGGLILLIARFQFNAFLALLLACLFVGIASRTDLTLVLQAITSGLGGILGSIAIVIGLGSFLGKLLAESGGATVVTNAFLKWFGEQNVGWAMMFVGLAIGIAVWFTVGLVLLIPIVCTLARQSGRSLLLPGLPMLAGLSVMHGLVPPHPGPMAAIGLLGADTGKTILYSAGLSLPLAALAGPIYARYISPRVKLVLRDVDSPTKRTEASSSPSLSLTLFTILLPVFLMLGATMAEMGSTQLKTVLVILGSPNVAMLIAVLFALYSFGFARGFDRRYLYDRV